MYTSQKTPTFPLYVQAAQYGNYGYGTDTLNIKWVLPQAPQNYENSFCARQFVLLLTFEAAVCCPSLLAAIHKMAQLSDPGSDWRWL